MRSWDGQHGTTRRGGRTDRHARKDPGLTHRGQGGGQGEAPHPWQRPRQAGRGARPTDPPSQLLQPPQDAQRVSPLPQRVGDTHILGAPSLRASVCSRAPRVEKGQSWVPSHLSALHPQTVASPAWLLPHPGPCSPRRPLGTEGARPGSPHPRSPVLEGGHRGCDRLALLMDGGEADGPRGWGGPPGPPALPRAAGRGGSPRGGRGLGL